MEEPVDLRKELEDVQRTNVELLRSIDELVALKDVLRRILAAPDEDSTMSHLVEAVRRTIGQPSVHGWLTEEAGGSHRAYSGTGVGPLPERDVLEWALREGRATTVPLPEERLLMIVPIVTRDVIYGFLTVDASQLGEGLSQQQIEQLSLLAAQGAASIANVRLRARLQDQVRDLATTKSHLSNILDSITNGIVTLDLENCVTQINRNASAMLDLELADAVGKSYAEALPKALVPLMEEILKETVEFGFAMERQYTMRTSSGSDLPLAIGTAILRDDAMAVVGSIVVFRDMTASKELDRLRRIDTMKSEFVANVSHELRTPLTSIKAYTEALLDMAEQDIQKNFLNVIDQESDRLLSLIEDLLKISRIERGKLKLKLEMCKPKVLLDACLRVSKVSSTKHNVLTELPDDLPEMLVDADKIKEVLINLISNAIKYSPKGGEVRVKMTIVEGNLQIDISDQGIGISEDNLPKLFNAFYRVDSTLTYQVSGTGLGLAIVKNICEAHGGHVGVKSTPNVGSVFTVVLPVKKGHSRTIEVGGTDESAFV